MDRHRAEVLVTDTQAAWMTQMKVGPGHVAKLQHLDSFTMLHRFIMLVNSGSTLVPNHSKVESELNRRIAETTDVGAVSLDLLSFAG